MKKWTMWVTGSGLSLLFVAVAVALAHRDSRNEIDAVDTNPTVKASTAAPVTLAWDSNKDSKSSSEVRQPESPKTSSATPLSATPPNANDFAQWASYESPDVDVVRGNDETPAGSGQPTPAAPPPAPLLSPFPFTKNSAPATDKNPAPATAAAPAPAPEPATVPATSGISDGTEVAQLPTLPEAIQSTQNSLRKVTDSAAAAVSDVGQALDPRRVLGGTNPPSTNPPRTLLPPPSSSMPQSNLPQGNLPPGSLPRPNLPAANSPPGNASSAHMAPNASPSNSAPVGSSPQASPPAGSFPSGNTPSIPNSTSSSNNAPPIATFGSSNGSPGRSISSSYPDAGSLSDTGGGGFSSGSSYDTVTSSLVSADPGERTIEGPQSPALQLIKRAPEEVRVGRNATFTMIVKNTGNVIARKVQVFDIVPNGTRFVAAQPAIQPDNDGQLVWDLGDIPAGNERVIQLQLIPESEGEIGSVASVTFAALASVRTLATQPKIKLTHNVAEQVLLSNKFNVQLKIENEGTGIAEGLSLEADLPANLKCAAGAQVVATIDRLQPGASKMVNLPLQAIEPGQANLQLRVIAEDEEIIQKELGIVVTAPQLQVSIKGPTKRYIERQARYVLKVENIGNASATNLDVVAQLPKGFRFNGTGQKGQYDASRHAVLWSLEELAAGIAAEVELDILPVDMGAQALRFQVAADLNAQAQTEATVNVEGLSELSFTISDDNDPVEVEGETNYSIKVSNSGTRADAEVQLVVELPNGAQLVGEPDAPVQCRLNGNQMIFAPIPSMKAKDTVDYQFTIRWTEEGQQNVRALVTSQNRSVPVTKEEGIEVYRDR
jgi:uncharacterized repeat protein (TIGR01451 family)